ncbi:hypothetical protein DEU56DRAFT_830093 [Suillus clintonianus]|uniref:uncharacterized protein n=1 Tax=Suillus clintonianus TaxID=1904413 RepID=UPI001B87B182|nr:uncharacterized protein DEU56DRAFT_830093 [Suillus clintonianus]KAG2123275.1 hypothetical protein DEU56DRAFT_830093 [Suillus clintonianus]
MVSTVHHNGPNDSIMDILQGRERIVSYPGTSQFNGRGISACGLAAMNFARVLSELVHIHSKDTLIDLLRAITSKEVIEDIISICSGWSSDLHLDVEEIQQVPLFEKSLKLVATRYGPPKAKKFMRTLEYMQSLDSSSTVIITRPPEIIACTIIKGPDTDVFVIFDSHPRPSYPAGAGLILSTSINQAASRLASILPAADNQLLSLSGLQWQAQLLNNFSGHIFMSTGPPSDVRGMQKTVVESSLTVLRLRAEVAGLTQKNERLTKENETFEGDIQRLEDALSTERRKVASLQTSSKSVQSNSGRPLPAQLTNGTAGLLRGRGLPARLTNGIGGSSWEAIQRLEDALSADRRKVVPLQASSKIVQSSSGWPLPARLTNGTAGPSWNSPLNFSSSSSSSGKTLNNDRDRAADSWSSTFDAVKDDLGHEWGLDSLSAAAALELQQSFDVEDVQLRDQMQALAAALPHNFSCAICMEEQPVDNSVDLECNHSICRTCIRGHVCSKIEEHRFPILCPVCMTETNNRQPGAISGLLVQQIGVDEKQYAIWEEMELSQFSVLLHCRKCQRTVSVDKEEHGEARMLVCPLPECDHIWCKACQQSFTLGGPTHSCDGTSELDHLMKKSGWKYCPNCKIPVQRDGGCSHMTCISPGCNTHFCYVCGQNIVRSALRTDIQNAVAAHYRVCKLFDDPGE